LTDAYAVNQLVAILARHPDVTEEHIGPLAIDRLQRGVSALDGRDEGAVLRDRRRRRRDRFGTPSGKRDVDLHQLLDGEAMTNVVHVNGSTVRVDYG